MSDFKPGDVVALRREFKKAKESDVSCVRLLDMGLPNEFEVLRTPTTTDGVPAVALSPCCGRLRGDLGEVLCEAHPAGLFELVRRGDPGLSTFDRIVGTLFQTDPKQFLGVEVPVLGSLVHFAHYDDGEREGIALRVLGFRPLVLVGKDLEALVGLVDKVRSIVGRASGPKA